VAWPGCRQLGAQEPLSLPHRNTALQQESADLIDDAGALADQPLPYPVQCLQVELIGGLGRHKLHRRPLHGLGDCLGIAEVILLSLGIGTNILRWHQPGIVSKAIELAAEMMRANAGFHPDQAWRQVGKAGLDLATRPLLPQHDGATIIVANHVERVFADIDADHSDCALELLGHGVLLSLAPLPSTIAGWAGRPDHPISGHRRRAADLGYRPDTRPAALYVGYDWSGFYVGANGGDAESRNCWSNTVFLGVATVPSFAEGCSNASEFTLGGQIGYRLQSVAWVFGVEAQGNWANLSASNQSLLSGAITNSTKTDAIGIFTGQVGYSIWERT
jgi:hypothetical protein